MGTRTGGTWRTRTKYPQAHTLHEEVIWNAQHMAILNDIFHVLHPLWTYATKNTKQMSRKIKQPTQVDTQVHTQVKRNGVNGFFMAKVGR